MNARTTQAARLLLALCCASLLLAAAPARADDYPSHPIRLVVPFAPAAMSWANLELRQRLLAAIGRANGPIFLLQAGNDYSTGPTEVLGAAIRKRGGPNQAKLYPAFGTTHQQGHAAFACWNIGTRIWGPDVLAFIDSVLPGR